MLLGKGAKSPCGNQFSEHPSPFEMALGREWVGSDESRGGGELKGVRIWAEPLKSGAHPRTAAAGERRQRLSRGEGQPRKEVREGGGGGGGGGGGAHTWRPNSHFALKLTGASRQCARSQKSCTTNTEFRGPTQSELVCSQHLGPGHRTSTVILRSACTGLPRHSAHQPKVSG